MTVVYRHSYCSCCNAYVIIVENLVGFVNHLHLFLGITVFKENIDMRQTIVCYLVCICLKWLVIALDTVLEIVNSLEAGTCNSLIS